MSEALDRFISHGLNTEWTAIPESAQQALKTFLLDSLGVGIAGSASALIDKVRKSARNWAGDGPAWVWGRDAFATLPSTAAFINGYQIHCQEFDCVHEAAVVHPMATILAALMAECDANEAISGAELGAALIIAVDLAAGLGIAATTGLKFFRPATAGIFGATLGLCRLRGFDESLTRNALGYALSFASGTMQAHVEGKQALPLQIANAARSAHFAADLARAGLTASENCLEGPFGYLPLFEGHYNLEPVMSVLGQVWRISEVSHKPYPTGRAAHGGLSMIENLYSEGIGPSDIASIELKAPPLIKRLVGRPVSRDMEASYARLCFAYLAAIALRDGKVTLADFSAERLGDEDVYRFAQCVSVTENEVTNPAAFTPQTLRCQLRNGSVKAFSLDALPGSPLRPLSKRGNEEKFRSCVAFGLSEQRWPTEDILIEAVETLEKLPSAAVLSRYAAANGNVSS